MVDTEKLVANPIKREHRLLSVFAYGTFFLLAGLLATLLYWELYPYNVISYDHKPFHLVGNTSEIRQGDVIQYEYTYTKYIDVQGQVSKQFVDGLVFQADSSVTYKPVGTSHVHSDVEIPKTLPPGKYRIRIIAVYEVNPIRSITVINTTDEFTVLPFKDHEDAEQDELLEQK